MFRLTFLLLVVLFVVMLVAGRDPSETEIAARRAAEATRVAEAQAPVQATRQADAPAVPAPPAAGNPPLPDPLEGAGEGGAVAAAEPSPDALIEAINEAQGQDAAEAAENDAGALASPDPTTDTANPAEPVLDAPAFGAPVFDTPALTDAAPELPPGEGDMRYVNASSVNIRSGPSTDFPVIGQARLGEMLEVLAGAGSGWVKIRLPGEDAEGYMSSNFLQTDEPGG